MRANAGVWQRKNGRFTAVVYRGQQTFIAGTWQTRRTAVAARDRALLYSCASASLIKGSTSRH